jgi:hypothetical protein
MKTKFPLLRKALILSLVLCVLTLIFGCGKSKNNPTPVPFTPTDANGFTAIDLIGLRVDSGFAYKLGYHLPQSGDTEQNPYISTLHLYENGVELGPAHATHADIRKYGLGQYSHWGTYLYFSTSDNSNPLTNGRKYSYKMQ